MTTKATGKIGEIRLGLLDKGDARDLERLAQRDSSAVPNGSVLGAWVDGQLLAALSVKSGHAVADPFVRTQELVELLDERATQLRGSRRGALARRADFACGEFRFIPCRSHRGCAQVVPRPASGAGAGDLRQSGLRAGRDSRRPRQRCYTFGRSG